MTLDEFREKYCTQVNVAVNVPLTAKQRFKKRMMLAKAEKLGLDISKEKRTTGTFFGFNIENQYNELKKAGMI